MMVDRIKQLSSKYFKEINEIREHLHANPELSFKEHNTSKYVQQKLKEYGIDFQAGYVETGIIGLIKGKNPASKSIALRGDMDALPIIEDSSAAYCSKNKGVMHACGHDVHTSCLLGAAKILKQLENEFEGTIKLIFQPGEERLPGGAKLMIEEGVLENPTPQKVIGQHVYPDLEVGKVGFKKGMYMASADELHVTVKGKGGHAALPHRFIDPILIASNIIVSLQQIVSRSAKPNVPSVLSFGKIIGEGSTNIIPDEVKLEGTFRTMDEEWRFDAHKKMKALAESIALGMGGSCDFDVRVGYPYLVNDEVVTETHIQAAKEYLGEENVVDLDLRMTAEDFSYYSQVAPVCFYRLGTRNEAKGITSGLHTSTFDIDSKALEIGMGVMAYGAIKQLG
ncbi:MAG: amidohydrolase [Flavobacteriales bacterium]|nr:amidohydrolase [Flavobacteriales bacterium]MBT6746464.1 amidohydrolase [Flavobacteriales bacterium]